MKDDKQEAPTGEVDKVEQPIKGTEAETPSDVASVNKAAKEELAAKAKEQPKETPAFNPETSYKDLQDRYAKQEKSYKELQKFSTQSSMKAAELEKKLESIAQKLAAATEEKLDPQDFIRDVNERGHAPIVELIGREVDKVRKALTEEFGRVTSAQEAKLLETEANLYVERLSKDTKNFPGFEELKESFGEILDDPNCPVKADAPILEQLVGLYQIAKSRSADQAVALAKAEGKQEAEAQIAKEAKANVAGGGKSAGTTEPDWENMPLDKHRAALVSMYGIRE